VCCHPPIEERLSPDVARQKKQKFLLSENRNISILRGEVTPTSKSRFLTDSSRGRTRRWLMAQLSWRCHAFSQSNCYFGLATPASGKCLLFAA
jgi:hypothetical protein